MSNELLNIQYPLNSINTEKKFFDVEENPDPVNLTKRQKSKHEFGFEYENIVPSEGEIRLLGNRHKQCRYYSIGYFI